LNKLATLLLLMLVNHAYAQQAEENKHPESNEVEFTQQEEWAWLDAMHANFSARVVGTANWFDGFFAADSKDAQNANGSAKVTLGWEPRAGDFSEFDTRFRLRVKLPNLKKSVDLIFSDYDEDYDQQVIEAARNEVFSRQDEINLALRWTIPQERSSFSTRIGIGKQAQLFTKAKYQSNFPLSEDENLKLEPSVYYYHRDGWGARMQVDYENSLDVDSLLRFTNAFIYRDEQQDLIFKHGIYNYLQLHDKQALICGFYVEGRSEPNYRVEEYLLSTRLRYNVLREWLYLEVEPFFLWRRDEGFDTSPGLAMRVQGYFGK
jgi:hypothetical protein